MPYVPPPVVQSGGTPGKASNTAQVTMSGTVTPTVSITYTIPAGSAVAGTTYEIYASGTIDNTATSPTFIFSLRLAGVVIATVTIASITAASTLKAFSALGYLTFRTVGGTGTVVGSLAILNEAAGTIIGAVNIDSPVVSGTTVNTAVGLALDLESHLGAATAGNIVRTELAEVALVKA